MLAKALVLSISLYKMTTSRILRPACRYYPTCSDYSIGAIEKHGFFKGTYLSILRILRCNRYFKGGFDPVR